MHRAFLKRAGRKPGARGDSRGFTILELLIAMAMLATGILIGVFPAQISAIFLNSLSFQKTTAMHIAQGFLENFEQFRLTQNPPNGLAWNNGALSDVGGGLNECPPTAIAHAETPYHRHRIYRNGIEYHLRWQVSDGDAGTETKQVTAVVIWEPKYTGKRSGQFATETPSTCMMVRATAVKYCSLGDGKPGRCP
jgi:prepilin-type N-terminal cleavage/methylation domain-containing protein